MILKNGTKTGVVFLSGFEKFRPKFMLMKFLTRSKMQDKLHPLSRVFF